MLRTTQRGCAGHAGAILLSTTCALLEPGPALADGKFYARDEVPAGGAYQRAVLLHGDGRELLVIQPKLTGEASDFGWIVPVPAEPRVGSLPERLDMELFENLGWETQPDVEDHSGRGRAAILLAGLIAALVWGLRRPSSRALPLLAALGFLILLGFFVPVLFRGRGAAPGDVEVLQSRRVGIYDVVVIRGSEATALRAWFEKHGFRSGPEDEAVLASYAARGWCFVTARIGGGSSAGLAREGLIPALVLLFPAAEPIYPFALTATSGEETEVLLYVLAEGKVSHPALELAYAGRPFDGAWMHEYLDGIDWSGGLRPNRPVAPGFLTKLRGRLSIRNAADDLLLRPAADDRPYRETRLLWW